ncbi:MAG: hypothetical protein ABIZ91_17065 [Gemmatimonadaceae bacterium]
MNMYFAPGGWGFWYGLLWLAMVPFGAMLLWTFLHLSRENSGSESTWLNGAVLGSFLLLILTSFASTLLFVWSIADRTPWTYLRAVALHFFAWTFLGSSVLFASLHALASGPRVGVRRLSATLATVGAFAIHAVSLYATFRFRLR